MKPSSRLTILAFGSAAFLGSALLFLIEPMIVKMILPRLGGSPSVWLTALVFFQATLLLGYAYSHASTNRLRPRQHAISHAVLMLLPLLFLPVALPARWLPPPGAGPLWVFILLVVAIGVPFFVLSTVSPVLQRWYSYLRTDRDPYFLYAVGNLGSLLGLLAYPFIVERFLGLSGQSLLWAIGYGIFLLFAGACALMVARRGKEVADEAQEPGTDLPLWTQFRWVFLAFVPSSLLLGVTAFLTSEVGSFPLLWVMPLAVYLITFIVAFARADRPVVAVGSALLKVTALIAFGTWALGLLRPLWILVALHCTLLLAAGLAAHGKLHEERPSPRRLTRFYLLISLGGVLGGMFNALFAPFLFVLPIEYPLVLVLALLLRKRPAGQVQSARAHLTPALVVAVAAMVLLVISNSLGAPGRVTQLLVVGVPIVYLVTVRNTIGFALAVGLLLFLLPPVSRDAIYRSRTFFGVYRVAEGDGARSLFNGMTLHGTQLLGERSREPTAYYHRDGPLGDVFDEQPDSSVIVVLGLGAGGMAAYNEPGSHFTFIEIDPEVVAIAEDTSLFTYLSEAPEEVNTRVGDGRLVIESMREGSADMVILDAFTGDALPVHLITVEAFASYATALAPAGKIVVNISNRYFELDPVISSAAEALGFDVLTRRYVEKLAEGARSSAWAVMAPNPDALEGLRSLPGWQAPASVSDFRTWTDEYSNLLTVLR